MKKIRRNELDDYSEYLGWLTLRSIQAVLKAGVSMRDGLLDVIIEYYNIALFRAYLADFFIILYRCYNIIFLMILLASVRICW